MKVREEWMRIWEKVKGLSGSKRKGGGNSLNYASMYKI